MLFALSALYLHQLFAQMSSSDIVVNTKVSRDGAWQKRGYLSLNGFSWHWLRTSIDNEVMSKKCKLCDIWENKKGTQEYTDWKCEHSYSINHEGSAGAMEVNWLKRIFSRSIRLHKLRYNFYIRDDDSKCFNEIILMV